METTFTISQDWENDGILKIKGAKTIQKYIALRKQMETPPLNNYGLFFAFSRDQFKKGYDELVTAGKIKEGEKVVKTSAISGLFGVKEGIKKLFDYMQGLENQIKNECDPQEVYYYEFNNSECFISYDGDFDAIKIVLDIWGEETAKNIKRIKAYTDIEDLK